MANQKIAMRHRRPLTLISAASALFAVPLPVGAIAQDGARGQPGARSLAARIDRTGTSIGYGPDQAQRILFWPAPVTGRQAGKKPPIALYVHGGGWSKGQPEIVDAKPKWFADHGWAFASIGYRLVPAATVEDQAKDIGAAIAKVRSEAARLGYDPDRILLFGHSAGAHLVALVGSDPQFGGASFAAIRGAILLDGAAYDVPAQIAASPFMARRTYIPAFGTDPARQRALSPLTHAGAKDVPDWLLLYTAARGDSKAQSVGLAEALRKGGAKAEVMEIPTTSRNPLAGHMEVNTGFGTAGFAANPAIKAMMRRIAN